MEVEFGTVLILQNIVSYYVSYGSGLKCIFVNFYFENNIYFQIVFCYFSVGPMKNSLRSKSLLGRMVIAWSQCSW